VGAYSLRHMKRTIWLRRIEREERKVSRIKPGTDTLLVWEGGSFDAWTDTRRRRVSIKGRHLLE